MCKYYNWTNGINEEELNEVAEIIKNNGVVIFPTETVYGIGGNALSCQVVDKVYQIKQRPREKAINILLPNAERIEEYADIIDEKEKRIIQKFMPGPITIILKRKDNIGNGFTLNDGTIGVRIPNSPIVQAILKKVNVPLIAPSANISGKPSGTDVNSILKDFENKVDAVIDGGKSKLGISSTIVKVVNGKVEILREGSISKEELDNI